MNVSDMLSVITMPLSQWPTIFFARIESFVCVEFRLNYHPKLVFIATPKNKKLEVCDNKTIRTD